MNWLVDKFEADDDRHVSCREQIAKLKARAEKAEAEDAELRSRLQEAENKLPKEKS